MKLKNALQPDELADTYNAGLKASKANDLVLAESLFRHCLEIAPRDVDSLCHLADILWELDRFDEAIPYLLKAEKIAGLTPEIADILSRCYKHKKEYSSAKRLLNRCLKKSETTRMLQRLGDIYRLEYNFQDAVDCYRAAIVLDDHNIGAFYHVHKCLIEVRWPADAVEIARKALRRWPDDRDFHINLIEALHENGQLKEARNRITIYEEKFGKSVDFYLQQCEVYCGDGVSTSLR